MKNSQEQKTAPWWQVGSMWLVVGFTAAALAACAVTIWIALQDSDALPAPPTAGSAPALVPAMQARNAVADRNTIFQRKNTD